MILDIVTYPDPRLKDVCLPVQEITPEIRQLAADMFETMYSAHGVGLAAPQVGKNLRMLVMDARYDDAPSTPRVIINPEIELLGEKITSEKEGCLSVPLNYRANVPRYSQARVSGLDLDGNKFEELLGNFEAIVAQHEIDHLNGILFIDKISHLRRGMYDGKVRKWMKRENSA